jgi:hypothetical protein
MVDLVRSRRTPEALSREFEPTAQAIWKWLRKACQRRIAPDPVEMAARYGAETPVLDWREKLVCSKRGGRQIDMAVTGSGTDGARLSLVRIAISLWMLGARP